MTEAVAAVIKTDAKGRMRTSAARREHLLAEFAGSGLSAKQFAELSGIKYQTLATWLQKQRRQGQTPVKSGDTVRWLEAVVERAHPAGSQPSLGLTLQLPGGVQAQITDAAQAVLAAALLRALAKSC